MTRILPVAAAQLGPIPRSASRRETVDRLIQLLRQGHKYGRRLVVFPEAALTSFFPHWYMDAQAEIDSLFRARNAEPRDPAAVR